jgi:hypothetical protein
MKIDYDTMKRLVVDLQQQDSEIARAYRIHVRTIGEIRRLYGFAPNRAKRVEAETRGGGTLMRLVKISPDEAMAAWEAAGNRYKDARVKAKVDTWRGRRPDPATGGGSMAWVADSRTI